MQQNSFKSKVDPERFTDRGPHDQLYFDGASYQDALEQEKESLNKNNMKITIPFDGAYWLDSSSILKQLRDIFEDVMTQCFITKIEINGTGFADVNEKRTLYLTKESEKGIVVRTVGYNPEIRKDDPICSLFEDALSSIRIHNILFEGWDEFKLQISVADGKVLFDVEKFVLSQHNQTTNQ